MKFKIGQTVRLINNNGLAAFIGATAVVTDLTERWLYVEWKTKHNGQGDGGYFARVFEPVIEVGEQLVFEFMR